MRVRALPARGLGLALLMLGLLVAAAEAKSKAQILAEIDSSIGSILEDLELLQSTVMATTLESTETTTTAAPETTTTAAPETTTTAAPETTTTAAPGTTTTAAPETTETAASGTTTTAAPGTTETAAPGTTETAAPGTTTTAAPGTTETAAPGTTETAAPGTTTTATTTLKTATATPSTTSSSEVSTTSTTANTAVESNSAGHAEFENNPIRNNERDESIPGLAELRAAVDAVQTVTDEVADGLIEERQTNELNKAENDLFLVVNDPSDNLITYLQEDPDILDEMIVTTSTNKKSVGNAIESEDMKITLIIVSSVLGGLLLIVTVAFITVYFTKIHKKSSKIAPQTSQLPLHTLHREEDIFGEGFDNDALQDQPIRAPMMRANRSQGPVKEPRSADYPNPSEVHGNNRRPSRIRLESKLRMSSQLNELGQYEPPRLVDDQRSPKAEPWNASPEEQQPHRPASKQREADVMNQDINVPYRFGRSHRESAPHAPLADYDHRNSSRRPQENSRISNDNFSYEPRQGSSTSALREPLKADYPPRPRHRVEQDYPYGGPPIPPKPQKVIRPMGDGDLNRARRQPQAPRRERRDMRGPYGPGDVY